MATVLTAQASIGCGHGGSVQLAAGQQKLTAGGAAVLVAGDLTGATVTGCTQLTTSSGNKQCTSVVSVVGGTAAHLKAGGKAALLDTVSGQTDGVPPGSLTVLSPGQTVLRASSRALPPALLRLVCRGIVRGGD